MTDNVLSGRIAPLQEKTYRQRKISLTINLPWMKNLLYRRNNKNPEEPLQRPHPITCSAERYSLYDRFHQKNQTRPEVYSTASPLSLICAVLSIPQRQNTKTELSFDRCFLCQMKETYFLFCTRLVFHLQDDNSNQTFIKEMEKKTKKNQIGPDGRLRLTSTGNFDKLIKLIHGVHLLSCLFALLFCCACLSPVFLSSPPLNFWFRPLHFVTIWIILWFFYDFRGVCPRRKCCRNYSTTQ